MPPKLALRCASLLLRSVSTHAHGLQAILQKKPDDVVITFAARTAMGRFKKGQLKDHPVDEILHALFKVSTIVIQTTQKIASLTGVCSKATLAKTKLDASSVDDICVGGL